MAQSKLTSSMMFGDCSTGNHEAPGGTWQPGERPRRACKGLLIYSVAGIEKVHNCGCECHAKITAMFDDMGLARIWPESAWRSEADREAFKAAQPQFDMSYIKDFRQARVIIQLPDNAAEAAPSLEDLDGGEVKVAVASIIPPNPTVQLDPDWTPGKQRVKGQLEYEVKLACDAWVLGAYPDIPTLKPHNIAQLISSEKPPSTGAIVNVLLAWGEIGFAITETSPHRFVSYTQAGIQLGIGPLRERREMTTASSQRTLKNKMLRGVRN